MTVHRFFVAPEAMPGERFALPPQISRQVRTVLRLGYGDRIVLLGGDGTEAVCRLEDDECVVESRRPSRGEPRHRLVLVQALLKGDALEEVVQHATELGVAEVRLVVADRCVARALSERRLGRLRSIAREAAEQSERGVIPEVHNAVPLAGVLRPGAILLAERHDGVTLMEVAVGDALIVGPEGGFSPREIEAARDAGVELAGLGPRILRAPTAALAGVALLLSRAGDFA